LIEVNCLRALGGLTDCTRMNLMSVRVYLHVVPIVLAF
jgi:hypothetical protein